MATAARTAIPPTIVPLTPERWPDLGCLFGPNGAYSNCWCMWWRLTNAEYNACTPQERHACFQAVAMTAKNTPPGLLAYRDGVPVGWCAIAPRPNFPRLDRSRDWHPLDE